MVVMRTQLIVKPMLSTTSKADYTETAGKLTVVVAVWYNRGARHQLESNTNSLESQSESVILQRIS